MVETDQLLPYVNCWNSVAVPVKFESWNPDAATVNSLPSPNFVLTFLPQDFLVSYLQSVQTDHTVNYVREPSDERIVRNAIASLSQLFACQPGEVIEAFAEYISQAGRYVDGLWNRPCQELVSSGAVSPVPHYRQVCIETAAKEHVIHLETVILAEEQEAPTATAVGQMLISGRELWKRCKRKLLDSFSSYSRNWSILGSPIFASTVLASSY
jgi:hypothetical protein